MKNINKALLILITLGLFFASCKNDSQANTAEAPVEKTYQQKIDELITQMKGSEEWTKALKEKSVSQNKSLDSIMLIDAIWMLQQDSINKAKVVTDTTSAK